MLKFELFQKLGFIFTGKLAFSLSFITFSHFMLQKEIVKTELFALTECINSR